MAMPSAESSAAVRLQPFKQRLMEHDAEEVTNPRFDGDSVREALGRAIESIDDRTPTRENLDRDHVLAGLEGMVVAGAGRAEARSPIPQPTPSEDPAMRMVEALAAHDTLNSAERAQLLLALGRILLQKGILTREELAGELRK